MTSMLDICVDNLVEKMWLLGTKRWNNLLVSSGLQNCVPMIQWRQGDRREWGAADQREYAICWVCWVWMNWLKSKPQAPQNPSTHWCWTCLAWAIHSHPKFCSYPVLTHMRKQTCCSNLPGAKPGVNFFQSGRINCLLRNQKSSPSFVVSTIWLLFTIYLYVRVVDSGKWRVKLRAAHPKSGFISQLNSRQTFAKLPRSPSREGNTLSCHNSPRWET